ncbi:MAG: universal stress protein [Bacteroidetes bacterium]|nr:MAG: universal stress protein [Bacteroidota bacterium]
MRTILVPTDYSDVANNALQYAVELAKFSRAKLVLMHAYQVPVPTGEVPVMMISPQELEKENLKRIENLEKKFAEKTKGEIKIESLVRSGFAVEEIIDVIKEKKADLVVMGVTGAGKVSEALIGSHTFSLMKQTQIPVLVVPKDARFNEVKKIVLAYNYNEAVSKTAIDKIKGFARLFSAKILVLDVEKPVAVPMYENMEAGESLERSLKGVEHVLFFSSSEDIADGINTFADDHKCDWVAMIPHKHNLLDKLFHRSNTKKMAFHTHIPLLSIHD